MAGPPWRYASQERAGKHDEYENMEGKRTYVDSSLLGIHSEGEDYSPFGSESFAQQQF